MRFCRVPNFRICGNFRFACALVIVGLVAVSTGCLDFRHSEPGNSSNKVTIAVTIPPQKEFVERVGEDWVDVIVMVPPGADPHTYEPLPSQMIEVSKAKLYVEIGSGIPFERTWLPKISALNPGMQLINSSEGIVFILDNPSSEDEHDTLNNAGIDPHVWLSPRNTLVMIDSIEKGLVKADPAHGSFYHTNAEQYRQELRDLDQRIRTELSQMPHQTILVYHPSWGYFCRDYRITQLAIEEEGKDPSPSHIEQVLSEARSRNISVIFASPEFPTRSADAIASQIGGRVIFVSPLNEHYLQNMATIAEVFSGNG